MDGLHSFSIATHPASHNALRASANHSALQLARVYLLGRTGYHVRAIDSCSQRSRASALIHRMYSSRGYDTEIPATLGDDLNRITLEAGNGEQLFGTLTLGFDSEQGLLADALYQEEVSAFRAAGRRLCEISKLAVDPEYGSKEVLASLFHLAYIYGHLIHDATDALIEVNPRHAGFYERRLGFRQIAGMRTCPRVNAPAVLLHIELAYMREQISRHAGLRDAQEKSLYPYFLPVTEKGFSSQPQDRERKAQLAALH